MKSVVTRPIFWVLVGLLLFVLYKAPGDVSVVIVTAAHVLVVLVNGFGTFLSKL
jgi:hypothetical protein